MAFLDGLVRFWPGQLAPVKAPAPSDPQRRAQALLDRLLSPAQREQRARAGVFDVTVNTCCFRFYPSGILMQINHEKTAARHLCVYPDPRIEPGMPLADHVIGLLLNVRADPDYVLAMAGKGLWTPLHGESFHP